MQIVGRRSSVFTRLPLFFAEDLAVLYEFVPIYDMTELSTDVYAGNPALKLPILRDDGAVLFGALNICRAIVERAAHAGFAARVVWPEELRDTLSRNAQELVWHCMAVQVQIVMGTIIGKLPAENVFFRKAQTGLESSLAWLNGNLEAALGALPSGRRLSIFEVSLFCLIEHLDFRRTVPLVAYPQLQTFAAAFGQLPAAQSTAYRLDTPLQAPSTGT
jgi:glutathione S-transferase